MATYFWQRSKRLVRSPLLESYRARQRLKACRREVEAAGLWFVDIPRTGSTTIKLFLEQKFGSAFGKSYMRELNRETEKVIPDHTTAKEARRILSPDLWDRIFTFAIVRNPWDRCYSFFRYRIANREIPKDFPFINYLRILERLNTRSRFSPFPYAPYFMSMCDFILGDQDQQLVKCIVRFENPHDLEISLKKFVSLDLPQLPRAEVLGSLTDYKAAYCEEGIDIVARIYRDDIECFEYSF